MTESGEPELYLEARRNGEPVDPGGWVRHARSLQGKARRRLNDAKDF